MSAITSTFSPAHAAVINTADLRALHAALNPDTHPNPSVAAILREMLEERSSADATPEERVQFAAYQSGADASARDGEMEVDENACVSKGEDNGAYVQAWVWVSNEQAGLAEDES